MISSRWRSPVRPMRKRALQNRHGGRREKHWNVRARNEREALRLEPREHREHRNHDERIVQPGEQPLHALHYRDAFLDTVWTCHVPIQQEVGRQYQMKKGGQRAGEPADVAERGGSQQQTQEHHGEIDAAERQGYAPNATARYNVASAEPPRRVHQPAEDHELGHEEHGVRQDASVPRVERWQTIEHQRGRLCHDPEGKQAGEQPQRPGVPARVHRRSLKNAWIICRHSSSMTPAVTANR